MSALGAPFAAEAPGEALWQELARLHEALLARVREHEQLCAAPLPDRAAMTGCRWRVAQAGRVRMDHLNGCVLPFLAGCSGGGIGLARLRDDTPAYQRGISTYVSHWTTDAIVADWGAYRIASQAFRRAIRARVAAEARVLRPLLERGA